MGCDIHKPLKKRMEDERSIKFIILVEETNIRGGGREKKLFETYFTVHAARTIIFEYDYAQHQLRIPESKVREVKMFEISKMKLNLKFLNLYMKKDFDDGEIENTQLC
jgi:hypothetical protein